jgi:hypothetical protein
MNAVFWTVAIAGGVLLGLGGAMNHIAAMF